MSDGTPIEWTDATWNPIRAMRWADGVEKIGWHCEHASPGCVNCYAERINKRLGTGRDFKPVHLEHKTRDGRDSGDVSVFLDDRMLLQPLRWQRARMIFVCSMTDLFADFVTDAMLDKVFAIAMLARRHTFQVLTKRGARMRQYWTAPDVLYRLWSTAGKIAGEAAAREDTHGQNLCREHWNQASKTRESLPLPNVWSGVSVEDQPRADARLPELLATPAAVRWISAEPLIEHVDLGPALALREVFGPPLLGWVVAGGESGPGARPMHPDWARSLRDQCAAAGVPFLFKQWGDWLPHQQRPNPRYEWEPGPATFTTFPGGLEAARYGKTKSGRLLDGVQHDGYPEAAHG